MRSKDLIANAKKANAATLAAAFQTGDETKMTEALATFCGDIEEAVLQQAQQEADERNQDTAIMAARGVHVLTSAEELLHRTGQVCKIGRSQDGHYQLQGCHARNCDRRRYRHHQEGTPPVGPYQLREHQLPDPLRRQCRPRFRCDMGQHHRQNQQGTDRRAERLQHDPAEAVRVYVYQPGPC